MFFRRYPHVLRRCVVVGTSRLRSNRKYPIRISCNYALVSTCLHDQSIFLPQDSGAYMACDATPKNNLGRRSDRGEMLCRCLRLTMVYLSPVDVVAIRGAREAQLLMLLCAQCLRLRLFPMFVALNAEFK